MQVHIRKARVSDPQSDYNGQVVDLLIADGIIKEMAPSLGAAKKAKVIEDEELCVSPGWVDVFADYREPGLEHKETIATGLAAAAAGGFTDVLLAPNTQPVIGSKSVVQYVLQAAAGNAVTLHPCGAATQNTDGKDLAEMMDMHANGAIAFTDGWKPIQSANLALKALEYVKAINGILIQLPIDTSLASGGLMHEGNVSTSLGMAGIPALAETIMLHRDIELLRYTGSRLHITGISSAVSVDMIRRAKAEGLSVTCSVTPYHLALTDNILRSYSSAYKVSPPIREEADRQALIAGLVDGTIDCIASHHRPHEWDAKAKEFEYAADGMAIQQLAYNIVWNTLKGQLTADRLVEVFSIMPRHIFGLPCQGIAVGATASLTLFSASGTTTLQQPQALSLGRNNPWLGQQLSGRVTGIINNRHLHINK